VYPFGTRRQWIGVHIASRILSLAEPGEVLVSRTVRDLVAGSGLNFVDHGTHALKGIPDEKQVLAATEVPPGAPVTAYDFDHFAAMMAAGPQRPRPESSKRTVYGSDGTRAHDLRRDRPRHGIRRLSASQGE
jgi:hypothetical protein